MDLPVVRVKGTSLAHVTPYRPDQGKRADRVSVLKARPRLKARDERADDLAQDCGTGRERQRPLARAQRLRQVQQNGGSLVTGCHPESTAMTLASWATGPRNWSLM